MQAKLEIVALQGTVSDWQGQGLRGGWQLLQLPQASCGLKVKDFSSPESAGRQAWHFAGLSPSSR